MAHIDAYLNRGIKDVIREFPGIEPVLDEYGIGCGPCMVGACLLKDIVEIHDLPADKEREMMNRIAHVICPDQCAGTGSGDPDSNPKPRDAEKRQYSPPMRILVNEHAWIKRFVALIPQIIDSINLDADGDMQKIHKCIEFIRQYADKFHHAKEEDILFRYFDESTDILKTMREDHKNARAHVSAMIHAVERKDKTALSEHMLAYGSLLPEHIKREDDILYPWMDRVLTTTQVGKLHNEFSNVEENAFNPPHEHERFIQDLEIEFGQ